MSFTSFLPIPAIDLMDGVVVRLRRGEAGLKTVYSENPLTVALDFEQAGALRIHIVDLNGAFGGAPSNWSVLEHIRQSVSCDIEVGGGLRTEKDVDRLLEMGVNYAILGTSALRDKDLIARLVDKHGPAIIVGIDARGGKVAVEGWVETSGVDQIDFAKDLESRGLKTVVATDIATDGMMTGPNLESLAALASATSMDVIASGGVRKLEDLEAIHKLGKPNLIGAIVGRAIYEGQIDVAEAVAHFN